MKKGLEAFGGVLVLLIIIVMAGYNGLAGSREDVASAAANVDTMLQRRSDLIPNLIDSVKSYAAHETAVFDAVLEARKELMEAQDMQQKAVADSKLDAALGNMNVTLEAYPKLKSDTVYIGLMDELSGSENRISTARHDYNEAVRRYNHKLVTLPGSLLGAVFGFEKADYFEADGLTAQVPDAGALLAD